VKKVLLHACCAPCTTYVHQWLTENRFNPTGFFYNPNIYPIEEYEKRKECMEHYAFITKLPTLFIDEEIKPEAGNCLNCYETRLRMTARCGRINNYDCFSTSLLVSPYQKHDLIRECGTRIAEEEGIEFLYYDLRGDYHKGIEISRELNLYRQKFCGCSASLIERGIKYEQIA
jgi:hypothetical protein